MRPAERITRDKQKVAKRHVRHAQGRDVVGSGMLQNVATCMVQYGSATLHQLISSGYVYKSGIIIGWSRTRVWGICAQ